MITLEKLRVYCRFKGDIDFWARSKRSEVGEVLTDADWRLIDELLQKLMIVGRGLASSDFENETKAQLLREALNGDVRERLIELSESEERS